MTATFRYNKQFFISDDYINDPPEYVGRIKLDQNHSRKINFHFTRELEAFA